MERIVDLSTPIEDHFRWPVERRVRGDFEKGDAFQATHLSWIVHGFTHMDSPCHMVPGGPTTSDIPLETTIGEAAVLDLTDVEPNEALDGARLAPRAAHLRPGDILLFKTAWGERRSINTPEFWTEAPYITRDGAEWLLTREVRAVAFDFPQDYTIRLLLHGEVRPIEEHVTHDVLLRNGVILIEYVVNTRTIDRERVWFCCLPLKVEGADGAPARVIASLDGERP